MTRISTMTFAKRAIYLAGLATAASSFAPPALATGRLLAGQYETTTVSADGNSRTGSRCITADEAKTDYADAKAARESMERASKGTCKVTAYVVDGDTVSSTMVCDKNVVNGRQTFHGNDAFDGDTTFMKDGKTVGTAHFTAKRTGECK
jgi:hypothetical protein